MDRGQLDSQFVNIWVIDGDQEEFGFGRLHSGQLGHTFGEQDRMVSPGWVDQLDHDGKVRSVVSDADHTDNVNAVGLGFAVELL